MPKALINGITGQKGSYLAEFLISKGYEVHGFIRQASTFNKSRIDHNYVDPYDPNAKFFLHYGDLSDVGQITNIIYNIKPDEVYHLGAQSHVSARWDTSRPDDQPRRCLDTSRASKEFGFETSTSFLDGLKNN